MKFKHIVYSKNIPYHQGYSSFQCFTVHIHPNISTYLLCDGVISGAHLLLLNIVKACWGPSNSRQNTRKPPATVADDALPSYNTQPIFTFSLYK